MFFNSVTLVAAMLAGTSIAGTVVWDGRFNSTSAALIDAWSFSNQVGAYQYYIHGSGATTDYVNIDRSFANPADKSPSTLGARLTVDSTSSWHNQTMMRTELIPSTKAPINKGKKYYHFSLKHEPLNSPDPTAEHQIAFFESHFTELKYGVSGSDTRKLQWMIDGKPQCSFDFKAGVWQNVAYGIDFEAKSVEFWHSVGGDALVRKVGPVDASVFSDGADWHVGILKFSQTKEDWYFDGVYIEEGEISTAIGAGAGAGAVLS
jgi:hypothetical protein